jgi:hypothetical protein
VVTKPGLGLEVRAPLSGEMPAWLAACNPVFVLWGDRTGPDETGERVR